MFTRDGQFIATANQVNNGPDRLRDNDMFMT